MKTVQITCGKNRRQTNTAASQASDLPNAEEADDLLHERKDAFLDKLMEAGVGGSQ